MFLEGWSLLDALYFSVVTLATVGFGDLHPTTNEAKLFTIAYIIFGVGIIAGFVSTVAKHRTEVSRPTPVIDKVEHVEEAMARAVRHEPRASAEPASGAEASGAEASGAEAVASDPRPNEPMHGA